jgi:hypothetical protein
MILENDSQIAVAPVLLLGSTREVAQEKYPREKILAAQVVYSPFSLGHETKPERFEAARLTRANLLHVEIR